MLLLNAKLEFIDKTTKQAFTKKNIIVKKCRLSFHPRLCLFKDLSGVYKLLLCDAVVTMVIYIFFFKFSEDGAVKNINSLRPWQGKLYNGILE